VRFAGHFDGRHEGLIRLGIEQENVRLLRQKASDIGELFGNIFVCLIPDEMRNA
jgi:hypothetical protein